MACEGELYGSRGRQIDVARYSIKKGGRAKSEVYREIVIYVDMNRDGEILRVMQREIAR